MSKRPGTSSNLNNPPKRARKPAGFRVARPTSSLPDQSSSASNSSLFITITQSDKRGILNTQGSIVSNDPTTTEPVSELQNNDPVDLSTPFHDSLPVEEVLDSEPKRKRETKNSVRYLFLPKFLLFLSYPQDQLTEWLKFRSTFLDEIIRHDGLGDFLDHTECSHCGKVPGVIKCKDCANGRMLQCQDCTVAYHQNLPMHRIEVQYFNIVI
jgi:hypothetical protein